jgi:hypothetical protein
MASHSFFVQVINAGPDLNLKDSGLDGGEWSSGGVSV